ncbi:SAM-dependent methyltransferase, partial [cyanobacterium G8-9]
FGEEWKKFDQSSISKDELNKIWRKYFSLFPWESLSEDAKGFDLGCGSGRWAFFVAPRVKELHCIDPSSEALNIAKKNLKNYKNCLFHNVIVDDIPFEDNSMDFGYSLGVLHHVPNTALGIKMCVNKLKPNAPFLLYLYYALDDKPLWFKGIWKASDFLRKIISILPSKLKYFASQVLALIVYLPLARLSAILEKVGFDVKGIPLSFYRDKSFYTMRTDALDRFGTRLEQRFTRKQIEAMMQRAGLERIVFREGEPYWCAIGYKKI